MNLPKKWPKTLPYNPVLYSTQMKLAQIRKFYFPFKETTTIAHLDQTLLKEGVTIELCPSPHPLSHQVAPLGHRNRRLVATRTIFANTIVGEYAGDVSVYLDSEKFAASVQNPSKYSWLIELPYFSLYIDAQKGGNELALINHYQGIQERPNLEPHFAKIKGALRFCYVTSCDIQKGEELLIDYGTTLRQ